MSEKEFLFEVKKCVNPSCGLRVTLMIDDPHGMRCPVCKAALERVHEPYPAHEVANQSIRQEVPHCEVLLDNIRSVWNVGSMLRSADGAGIERVHLCGITALPDHPRVAKTALGAEKSMPWCYHADGLSFCQQAKAEGFRLWALEGGLRAVPLFDQTPPERLLLVVGNELTGVDPDILEICERVVCLPMEGVKGSLNVAVAFGTAVYQIRFGGKSGRHG